MKKIISTRYTNLDQIDELKLLKQINPASINLSKVLTPERIAAYKIENNPITFSYATSLVNDQIIDLLQKIVDKQGLIKKYERVLAGEIMNPGEKRKVLHHITRSDTNRSIYGVEQTRIAEFAKKVQSGAIRGSTGKKITDIVQIGIGGSDLGPRMLYEALEGYVLGKKGKVPIKAHFISNVDPDDINKLMTDKKVEVGKNLFGKEFERILDKLDVERTMFIVVSKSGTTQETLTNLNFAKEAAEKKAKAKGLKKFDISKQFIAVTGKGGPMDDPKKYLASFYIDDNIGGRYSSTSAVGGTVLSLAFGPEIFEELLQGANAIDKACKEKDIRKNAALLDAAIGMMERNVLNYSVKGVIPYSKALQLFAAHLQQLDCESNGKSVNIYSEKLPYQTGPMVFGVPGTDGQHSFFQKIHQGTDVIPIEFIGVKNPQINQDSKFKGSTSQEKLKANLAGQLKALATGKEHKDANEAFSGNRETSLLLVDQITPKTIGALLAYFENKVMFQGFLWNLNSFDQPGVQLGKLLTDEVLKPEGPKDPVLKSIKALIG